MAAAPAVRLLVLLLFGVFIWFLWQIFQTPTAYRLPKASRPFEMSTEPNLDRSYSAISS